MSEINKIKSYIFKKFNNLVLNDNKQIGYPFMDPFINHLSQSRFEKPMDTSRPFGFIESTPTPVGFGTPMDTSRPFGFRESTHTSVGFGSYIPEHVRFGTPMDTSRPSRPFGFRESTHTSVGFGSYIPKPVRFEKPMDTSRPFGSYIPEPVRFEKPMDTSIPFGSYIPKPVRFGSHASDKKEIRKRDHDTAFNISSIKHKDGIVYSCSSNNKRMKENDIHTLFNLTSKMVSGSSITLNDLSYFFEYEQDLGNLTKQQYFDKYIKSVIEEVYNEYLQNDKCCYHFITNLMLEY